MSLRPDRALWLKPAPASVRESPAFVRTVLDSWGLSALSDDASLLVTELVSNAVVRARTPLTLTVSWRREPGHVRVTVHDDSACPPRPRDSDVTATNGRGMLIVEALAHSFGVMATGAGKDVWRELVPERACAGTPSAEAASG